MNQPIIIYIGGFAASDNYSKQMCNYLQYITTYKVYNCSLLHGKDLEEECFFILSKIPTGYPLIIVGFSTGCVIAMKIAIIKLHIVKQCILINPAELLTRLNKELIYSLVESPSNYMNIITFLPMFKKSNLSIRLWCFINYLINILWYLSINIFGSTVISNFYYYFFGKNFNEPRPEELSRVLFNKSYTFSLFKKTLINCLIQPSLYSMIKTFKKRIHILYGSKDETYIPYVNSLNLSCDNIILHKFYNGDHHMIYHKPIEIANKLSAIII